MQAGGVSATIPRALTFLQEVGRASYPDRCRPGEISEAGLLRKFATKPTAAATLSTTERQFTIPRLLKAGPIVANNHGLTLHPDVAASLMP